MPTDSPGWGSLNVPISGQMYSSTIGPIGRIPVTSSIAGLHQSPGGAGSRGQSSKLARQESAIVNSRASSIFRGSLGRLTKLPLGQYTLDKPQQLIQRLEVGGVAT